MASALDSAGVQRVIAVVVLVVAGVLSLPVAAAFVDGEGSENWILPAQLGGMAVVGAVVGRLLPGLAGEGSHRARAAWIGAAVGVGAALVGLVLFFLLLNGFDGA
jgi:hypothetical protein